MLNWLSKLRAARIHLPNAVEKIAFDRFHVAKQPGEVVDKTRQNEPPRFSWSELTVYAVACGNGFPADGRTDLFTPENTGKSHNRHETCHSASGHSDTFP
ncbi:ISL3 family transposase [Shigella flexneri]|nr:ISL3 family transposase [Shigella flexneri]